MAVTLEMLIRFVYMILVTTFFLMVWASLIGAREIDTLKYPPCTFNPLCTCSKPAPDLGIVQCRHVPFPAIPKTVNNSKVFMLHMQNTGLRELEPYFLQATGLYRLEISHNPLTEIPDDSFIGLERSLWELMLQHNELIDIPSRAIRHLQKLRHLDLSDNHIACIELESFRGLEDSLQTLILADNSLNKIPPDSFSTLPLLETLDLSGNNIARIDANIFRDGMPRLTKLLMADNILTEIPYMALAPLRQLRTLDLSQNLIDEFIPTNNDTMTNYEPIKSMVNLQLDNFHLEYNLIEAIPSGSFQNFGVINRTYLDGNPIAMLGDEAFRPAKIRELYIRQCKLHFISPNSFDGLGNSLQILDLSGNNITNLPENLFNNFDAFRVLNLKDNRIVRLMANEAFAGFQFTLLKFDVSGDHNTPIKLQDLRRLRNMRSLSLSRLSSTTLAPDDFIEYGLELEDLKITRGTLKTIKSHAFLHIRGIKRLDLSENRISQIESDAFAEIGHSLVSLKISHGFDSSLSSIPSDVMRPLTSLQELDFSNNQIKTMTDTCFHFLKNLRVLALHDNRIEQVLKGTFQGDIHSKLELISMSFNNLKHLIQHTFVDLEALQWLHLDDNRIEHIERRAFMNLDQLKVLSLRGNKLQTIGDEAFQNLPELELLDLAYNSLTNFEFDHFDQVGTLSSLRVNASHNNIVQLNDNNTGYSLGRGEPGTIYHSNIKILDLSHNNITRINSGFFKPAEISLTHLYLGHNSLTNTTRDIFGSMPHLEWLDLSYNRIREMDFDTFRNTKQLQVFRIAHNRLTDIPANIFKLIHDLRVVDFSYNRLRNLPEYLFPDDGMESLDLSHNHLTKIPVTSLSNLAALTLCELDLSHNDITAIHSMDLSNKFRALSSLDLSYNKLFRLDDAAFATLPRLSVLDLSNNEDLKVMDKAFVGLQNSLIKLNLDNVSLSTIPELPLPHLRVLSLSNNELPSIPQDLAHNISALRDLDLSENDLTYVPLLTQLLTHLRSLSIGGNSITSLTNNSFEGLSDTLEYLDISHLNLKNIEVGTLEYLDTLRSVKLSTYPNIKNFNIPKMVAEIDGLRELWIEAPQPMKEPILQEANIGLSKPNPPSSTSTDLREEMKGHLPSKLRTLTISGNGFIQLADNVFDGLQSSSIHISLINTDVSTIQINLFKRLSETQNISLDVSQNNSKLSKISNPNTASVPYLPDRVFLTDLHVSGNQLNCDCSIGWIEYWQRKKRQYFCTTQSWTDTIFNSAAYATTFDADEQKEMCDKFDDDLREARCSNKNNQPLLEVLKNDLECGWDNGATNIELHLSIAVLSILICLWF